MLTRKGSVPHRADSPRDWPERLPPHPEEGQVAGSDFPRLTRDSQSVQPHLRVSAATDDHAKVARHPPEQQPLGAQPFRRTQFLEVVGDQPNPVRLPVDDLRERGNEALPATVRRGHIRGQCAGSVRASGGSAAALIAATIPGHKTDGSLSDSSTFTHATRAGTEARLRLCTQLETRVALPKPGGAHTTVTSGSTPASAPSGSMPCGRLRFTSSRSSGGRVIFGSGAGGFIAVLPSSGAIDQTERILDNLWAK
jgi:hypothetical protein